MRRKWCLELLHRQLNATVSDEENRATVVLLFAAKAAPWQDPIESPMLPQRTWLMAVTFAGNRVSQIPKFAVQVSVITTSFSFSHCPTIGHSQAWVMTWFDEDCSLSGSLLVIGGAG